MKLIVDEMPFWSDGCPFYNPANGCCKLDGDRCERADTLAGERSPYECDHLMTLEAYKKKKATEQYKAGPWWRG